MSYENLKTSPIVPDSVNSEEELVGSDVVHPKKKEVENEISEKKICSAGPSSMSCENLKTSPFIPCSVKNEEEVLDGGVKNSNEKDDGNEIKVEDFEPQSNISYLSVLTKSDPELSQHTEDIPLTLPKGKSTEQLYKKAFFPTIQSIYCDYDYEENNSSNSDDVKLEKTPIVENEKNEPENILEEFNEQNKNANKKKKKRFKGVQKIFTCYYCTKKNQD